MNYIAYLDQPLRTVSAKQELRRMLSAAMACVTIRPAEELKSEPRPERQHPRSAACRPSHSDKRLTTGALFSKVPVAQVARSTGLSVAELLRWGNRVPLGYEAFLIELLTHHHQLDEARDLLSRGRSMTHAATILRTEASALRERLVYFSMLPTIN